MTDLALSEDRFFIADTKGGDEINDLSKSKALKEEKDDILDLMFARGGSSS